MYVCMTVNVEWKLVRSQRGELTEDEEDAQREEHRGKPQTPDPQGLIICRGGWTDGHGSEGEA